MELVNNGLDTEGLRLIWQVRLQIDWLLLGSATAYWGNDMSSMEAYGFIEKHTETTISVCFPL